MPNEISSFEFLNFFPQEMEFNISIHLIKQNVADVLRQISGSISENENEFADASKSNINKDVINKVKEDAKSIRYEMQINNQEIYNVYILLRVTSTSKEDLELKVQELKSKLITKLLKTNLLHFRHIVGFLATAPFCYNIQNQLNNYYINMTTNNLKAMYPFYTPTIIEKNGILIGKVKKDSKLCIIDLFNKNHFNSNICIFGSSGSGKSYFTKLLILRNYLKGIKQYVIDGEGEYLNLPSEVIDFSRDKINILEITEDEVGENFLEKKVNKVCDILKEYIVLEEDEESILKEAIFESYSSKNITSDENTLYSNLGGLYLNKKFRKKEEFPIFAEVIENLSNKKSNLITKRKELKKKVSNLINNELVFLNGVTTVNITKDIVIFDISKLNESHKSVIACYILTHLININKREKNKLIYIDEVWKLMYKNEKLKFIVFDLYKTVRKRNAGIITITQDISDIFNKNNDYIGKSIFNNSYIKLFFKTEFQDVEIYKNMGMFSDDDYMKIYGLTRGEMFMYLENKGLVLSVQSNKYERKLIEGDNYDSCSN